MTHVKIRMKVKMRIMEILETLDKYQDEVMMQFMMKVNTKGKVNLGSVNWRLEKEKGRY